MPNIYIRSSLIVGFPGETEQEFEDLCQFVELGLIDNLGIFMYSQEEGSVAAEMTEQVDQQTKSRRLNTLSAIQQKHVAKHNERMLGRQIEVVIDGYHPDSPLLLSARFYGQAPDVDPCVIINERHKVKKFGHRYIVEITGSVGYDLIGRVIKKA